MNQHVVFDRIRAAARKTARILVISGPLVVLLGAFMISLHAFELDPETADMTNTEIGLLYGFAVLFIATGIAMVYIGLFVIAKRGAALIGILASDPSRLVSVTYKTVQHASAPGELGKVHQLSFVAKDTKPFVVRVERDDVPPILEYVRQHAPHALAS